MGIREELGPTRGFGEVGSGEEAVWGQRRPKKLLDRAHALRDEQRLPLARLPAMEVAG